MLDPFRSLIFILFFILYYCLLTVKGLILSTVKGIYLAIIRNLETIIEMWDTLKAFILGSKEMKKNKLYIACNKFDDFKMLPRETIEGMKICFTKIFLEIDAIKLNKYTQHEKNLKVTRSLPANWHVYVALISSWVDLNSLSTEKLFDILVGNEYDMIRIHGSTQPYSSKKVDDKKDKDVAFNVDIVKETAPNSIEESLVKKAKKMANFQEERESSTQSLKIKNVLSKKNNNNLKSQPRPL